VYFGGWDGISSCHDSVSITVTEDTFQSLNPHDPMIATGAVWHVNNPSALQVRSGLWLMVTTQLPNDQLRNKPAISFATNGIDWKPNSGGLNDMVINGYPGFNNADINGCNVIFYDGSIFHLYFCDFHNTTGTVKHATTQENNLLSWNFQDVVLDEPFKLVNDVKLINGYYVMGLHVNGVEVFYSISKTLDAFPPSQVLFNHYSTADAYVLSELRNVFAASIACLYFSFFLSFCLFFFLSVDWTTYKGPQVVSRPKRGVFS
jgi:hypothetical protein